MIENISVSDIENISVNDIENISVNDDSKYFSKQWLKTFQ